MNDDEPSSADRRPAPRQRGGSQPDPLSATDIVQAALRIIEASHFDELTVRAVADECGVTAPAVHYHLRGGPGLESLVLEAVAARIRLTSTASDPIDRYVELVRSMDSTFSRYPGVGWRVLVANGPSPAAGRLTQTALQILHEGGWSEVDAVRVFTDTYLLFTGWLATRERSADGRLNPALAAADPTGAGTDFATLEPALRRLLTPPNTY